MDGIFFQQSSVARKSQLRMGGASKQNTINVIELQSSHITLFTQRLDFSCQGGFTVDCIILFVLLCPFLIFTAFTSLTQICDPL